MAITSSELDMILNNLKSNKKINKENIYELYKGEEFLGKGTAKELARDFNIPVRSIYSFASKEFRERATEESQALIAFKEGDRPKPTKFKTILEEKADMIVDLYFKDYDLKTLLKVIKYE